MAELTAPSWWYQRGFVAAMWLPLSLLFFLISVGRRQFFRWGLLKSERLSVPVLVVGNLVVGGSGKTPATVWLVEALKRRGWRPGILSRGYGGSVSGVFPVLPSSDPALAGDEPVLMSRRAAVPVWVGRDRVAAGRALLAVHPEVNVLVTDDGLQHYRLHRDAELLVLDERVLGNRWLLPAGPLREPLSRARKASLVLAHGALSADVQAMLGALPVFPMRLMPGECYRLAAPTEQCAVASFAGLRVRAIAGIGRPGRFFDMLNELGLSPSETSAFPDHHPFRAEDLALHGCDVLLMTEKDAIKCAPIAPAETWVLPVAADIPEAALNLILERLHGSQTA